MTTLHASARRTSQGFVPMVTLRNPKGQMFGSHIMQHGTTFADAAAAKSHALVAALRAAMRNPSFMTVAR